MLKAYCISPITGGNPISDHWDYIDYRGVVLSTATLYEFCGVQPSCKATYCFYILLKDDKHIKIFLKFSSDQQSMESSNLPWLSARSFVDHCQPCCVGGLQGDRVMVMVNKNLHKYMPNTQLWAVMLSVCLQEKWIEHSAVDREDPYSFWLYHFVLGWANQIIFAMTWLASAHSHTLCQGNATMLSQSRICTITSITSLFHCYQIV